MLPKESRLKTKKEFDLVYKKGKNYTSGNLYAKIFFKTQVGKPRIGFVISRKVESKAVKRNQVKRVLRSISRRLLTEAGPADILIIVRRVPPQNQYQTLCQDLETVLKEGGVLR